MQDRAFPIAGRNPTSTGAAIRVDAVPCDFILVAGANISDLPAILPALRSRIAGNGYEVVLNAVAADSPENRAKMAQFMAQEITKDGRIPPADSTAIGALIEQAKVVARTYDGADGLSLRFRILAGILKLAGDLAATSGSSHITAQHIALAIEQAAPAESQLGRGSDRPMHRPKEII